MPRTGTQAVQSRSAWAGMFHESFCESKRVSRWSSSAIWEQQESAASPGVLSFFVRDKAISCEGGSFGKARVQSGGKPCKDRQADRSGESAGAQVRVV